jgi:hypothetical protein
MKFRVEISDYDCPVHGPGQRAQRFLKSDGSESNYCRACGIEKRVMKTTPPRGMTHVLQRIEARLTAIEAILSPSATQAERDDTEETKEKP